MGSGVKKKAMENTEASTVEQQARRESKCVLGTGGLALPLEIQTEGRGALAEPSDSDLTLAFLQIAENSKPFPPLPGWDLEMQIRGREFRRERLMRAICLPTPCFR